MTNKRSKSIGKQSLKKSRNVPGPRSVADRDWTKITVPRDDRGWPILLTLLGGGIERSKNRGRYGVFTCGCGYSNGSFVLDAQCRTHVDKIIRVADYDKKRRVPPLWKPNG